MSEERVKILKMLSDGLITADEANQLLNALKDNDSVEGEFMNEEDFEKQKKAKKSSKFKEDLKSQLHTVKEELVKAKNNIVREIENVDLESVKDKVKQGIEKIDQTMDKVDQAIVRYGMKIKDKLVTKEDKNGGAN